MRPGAPVVLFVYNRPWHTLQTLSALAANSLAAETVLYIFADGPKDDSPELAESIAKTREVIRQQQWCGQVHIKESPVNRGLATSITSGVSEVVREHGRVIVLEDDIVTSPGFLKYMNDALELWNDEEKVMHISGYNYPVNKSIQDGTLFVNVLSCWGWATWDRAWKNYSEDTSRFLEQINTKEKIDRFNVKGNAGFYEQLVRNHNGTLRSWAVKWYASWYLQGGFSLFPKTTLVKNIGHDGTGVNCGVNSLYNSDIIADFIEVSKIELKDDQRYRALIDRFYLDEKKQAMQSLPISSRVKIGLYRLGQRLLGKST